jgi:hypothetical protein
MNRTHGKHALFVLAAWVGLAGAASCLSSDDAPAGGHVEHPQSRASMPVASAEAAPDGSPPPPEGPFTPLDQAIAGDCPEHAWSQNVPDRDCTSDGECGDGFCDRGHCAAIWTCRLEFGQRCVDGRRVPSHAPPYDTCRLFCIDGRCRSCQSDAECDEKFGGGSYACVPLFGAFRTCRPLGPRRL